MIDGLGPRLISSLSIFNKPSHLVNTLALAGCWFATLGTSCAWSADKAIDFDREIRPILSDNCFHCHGPDQAQRKAELRLDDRDSAARKGAINEKELSQSEILLRVFSDRPDEQMPPPESNKKLSSAQKELLKRWVSEGANYTRHWSFEAPVKAQVPNGVHPIDYLLGASLQKEGLGYSELASPATLARRLSLDLTGLPPKLSDVDALEADYSEASRSAWIDTLLASPHYGERMAIAWLDVVRFADTIGYHSDTPRNIYPYRDYVIHSFNTNKPFNQFTIEQVAGDLLPEPTQEQLIASGFNRLLLTTEEGGAQAKDYEARYLGDRVRAVGTVWLGLTIGCSQCHDHKFDPITMRDFYSMGAFFADIEEPIIGKREDGLVVPSPDQARELQRLKVAASQLRKEFEAEHPRLRESQLAWQREQLALSEARQSWVVLAPRDTVSESGATLTASPDGSVLASGKRPDQDRYVLTYPIQEARAGVVGLRLEVLPHNSLPAGGSGRAGNGNFVLTEITAKIRRADGTQQDVGFAKARASIEQASAANKHPDKKWSAASTIDKDVKGKEWGWAILPDVTKPQSLHLNWTAPSDLAMGDELIITMHQDHSNAGHLVGNFRWSLTSTQAAIDAPLGDATAAELVAILKKSEKELSDADKIKIRMAFHASAEELKTLREQLSLAEKRVVDYEKGLPRTLISKSMAKPRLVRILPRGNWQDESGEIVSPALPSFMGTTWDSHDRQLTRLDLANWLVDRRNPLTARVFVNRLWKQFFGTGLARNLDDVGAQGEAPTHAPLLDYLAVEFMDSGWNVKHIVRLIVSSRAYQQSSVASPELQSRDPENRLLARQARYRLPAELVRDNALAITELLVPTIGGPSIKPYQPEGYWENLNFPVRTYQADQGGSQYRRGLYVWWQRSFVHPSMLAFDAPTREECNADRPQSNIPQQALVLLNDPTYVEAAKAWASKLATTKDLSIEARIQQAFRSATSRVPSPREVDLLRKLYDQAREQYQQDNESASKLLSVGQTKLSSSDTTPEETAAWLQVTRAILNLHEVITRN